MTFRTLSTCLTALALATALNSCKKEERTTFSSTQTHTSLVTKATIFLNSVNGPVSGITVYAYDEDTWKMYGDEPFFARGTAASDDNGNAIFHNIEYPAVFTPIKNNQNTFYFSAHYSVNGVYNKQKVKAVTFVKGQQKTITIILD